MNGYCGYLLNVDLTSGTIEKVPLDEEMAFDYMGGTAMAARILFDRKAYLADPLGPDNTLVFVTGPISGTVMPGSGRFQVAARSPLTNGFGLASCGGHFGAELKFTGYDGVIITGASPEPVYLLITETEANLLPAGDLWGKTSGETEEAIRAAHNDKRIRTSTIGPAGENMVRYACIIGGKHNVAGRTGLGAVMGSKKLKAVAVRGKKRPTLADEDTFKTIRERCLKRIEMDVTCRLYGDYGTDGTMQLGMLVSDVPTKNWRIANWDKGSDKLNGITMADTILSGHSSCYACPVGCKRVITIPDGPYKVKDAAGPEYENVAALGTMQLIDDLDAVSAASEICNQLGVDTISAGSSIAFMRECYTEGLVDDSITGMPLRWGDAEQVIDLLGKISRREGVGDFLAEGVKRMSEKIGKGSENFAVHAKGMEAPMHDPRAYHGLALAYAVSPRGADHIHHFDMVLEMGAYSYPEFGASGPYHPLKKDKKADMVAASENIGYLASSMVMCHFLAWPMLYKTDLVPLCNAATGFDWTISDFVAIGNRAWYLMRAFNNLCGLGVADDKLPRRVLSPHPEGKPTGLDEIVYTTTSMHPPDLPYIKEMVVGIFDRIIPVQKSLMMSMGKVMSFRKLKGAKLESKCKPDLEHMLREYYTVRELDERGFPRARRLRELELDDVAEALHGESADNGK